jgi:hypothetical protein
VESDSELRNLAQVVLMVRPSERNTSSNFFSGVAEGFNPDHVQVFAGSTPPLHFGVIAFTSPQKSYVTAGFEAGMHAAAAAEARVIKVPPMRNPSAVSLRPAGAQRKTRHNEVCLPS